jgi:hypothetical protein
MLPKLARHFQGLEKSKAALLERLSALNDEVLYRKLSESIWSLAEIAQHLVLVEEEVLRQFRAGTPTDRRRRTLRDRGGLMMVNFVFRKGIRVKAPMRSVVPVSESSMDEICRRWNEVRLNLNAHLDSLWQDDLDRLVFHHPVAGRMNVEQTLELLELHFSHHLRQIARTERAIC